MIHFHFLRPWWWLALIPFLLILQVMKRQKNSLQSWETICDPHLLQWMMQDTQSRVTSKPFAYWKYGLLSFFFIIVALTGPTWSRLPTPIYQNTDVQVFMLDLSQSMLNRDIKPDRLSRARFILTDLLNAQKQGQFGMIAYTGEPFVVSPLTEDPHSIESLLSVLTPDIMPLEGQDLALALEAGENLIEQAGFKTGNILIFTASPPTDDAIQTARALATRGIYSSIMPLSADSPVNPLFSQFAEASRGKVLSWTPNNKDLKNWPSRNDRNKRFQLDQDNTVERWKDEGRWFLIPALLFLLPVFRRGWLQGVTT